MEANQPLNLAASWTEVKERLKEANSQLTDELLDYTPGNEKQLLLNLSQKLSMSPGEVKAWIESVSSNKGKAS